MRPHQAGCNCKECVAWDTEQMLHDMAERCEHGVWLGDACYKCEEKKNKAPGPYTREQRIAVDQMIANVVPKGLCVLEEAVSQLMPLLVRLLPGEGRVMDNVERKMRLLSEYQRERFRVCEERHQEALKRGDTADGLTIQSRAILIELADERYKRMVAERALRIMGTSVTIPPFTAIRVAQEEINAELEPQREPKCTCSTHDIDTDCPKCWGRTKVEPQQ